MKLDALQGVNIAGHFTGDDDAVGANIALNHATCANDDRNR
jgi:hypothetical protein